MKKDYVVEPGSRKLFVELHRRKLLVNFAINTASTRGVKVTNKARNAAFLTVLRMLLIRFQEKINDPDVREYFTSIGLEAILLHA